MSEKIALIPFAMMWGVLLVVRWYHRKHGPRRAAEWRDHGRKWAIYGQLERSEWCHARADWFELKWYEALVTLPPSSKPPGLK